MTFGLVDGFYKAVLPVQEGLYLVGLYRAWTHCVQDGEGSYVFREPKEQLFLKGIIHNVHVEYGYIRLKDTMVSVLYKLNQKDG